MTNVTLYTRQNCHLCEDAKKAIQQSGVAVELHEVDIDLDLDLLRRYNDHVPVIFIDGGEAFRHRVDASDFAALVRCIERGWRVVDGHHLEKETKFPDFAQALAFTNQVGAIAEEMQHHPDIELGWGRVKLTTWTHDANGLTKKDYALVEKIESLFGATKYAHHR